MNISRKVLFFLILFTVSYQGTIYSMFVTDEEEWDAQRRKEEKWRIKTEKEKAKNYLQEGISAIKSGDYRAARNYFESVMNNLYATDAQKSKADKLLKKMRAQAELPPALSLQISFVEPSGNGFLDAEEQGELTATVWNNGKGSAYDVRLLIEPQSKTQKVDFQREHSLSLIGVGEKKSAKISFSAGEDMPSQTVRLLIKCLEESGFDAAPKELVFQTKAFEPPKLVLADVGVTGARGQTKVEPGELIDVTARIQNRGTGKAKNVSAKLNIDGANVFTHGETVRQFSQLQPGEYADAVFTVFTNTRFQGKQIPISLEVSESKARYGFKTPLPVSVHQSVKPLQVVKIEGKEILPVPVQPAPSLTLDIHRTPPRGNKENPAALAVIFGIEDYKKVSGVTYARRDATIFRNYAVNVLGVPDSKNNIYFLSEDVTKAEFDKAFSEGGWLFQRVKPDSDVYVYYAGHGAPDIESRGAYLIPQDGDPNYPSQTGFFLDALLKFLSSLKCNSVTVFLDACFSGADRENRMLLASARPILMPATISLGDPAKNLLVFSAAKSNQISSGYPEKQHGLFSYFLMKGLRGEADKNKDGVLTAGELQNYIRKNVEETAISMDRKQTPELLGDAGRVVVRYR